MIYLLSCIFANAPFLTFETTLDMFEYMFDPIKCRADGKRPMLDCLVKRCVAMLGSDAKLFQDHGKVFDDWPQDTAKWKRLWSESTVFFEHPGPAVVVEAASGVGIPSDLKTVMKSMAGSIRDMAQKQKNAAAAYEGDDWNVDGEGAEKGRGKKWKVSAGQTAVPAVEVAAMARKARVGSDQPPIGRLTEFCLSS